MRHAIGLESEHAESYFWLGRLLEADGQKAAAWESFSKARDLDYNPFRALSSFNEMIRALARENDGKGVYLLDLERRFADASKYAAPGFDLFLDYVHPTKPANLIVAQNAFDLLTHRVLKTQPATEHFSYRDLPIAQLEPYRDETDVGISRELHWL
jgi:tetratricopeptide (TPR) repeat protein